MPQKNVNILGVRVRVFNLDDALNEIGNWIIDNCRQYICVANVHTVTESVRNNRLRGINNRAGMVTPDGMPLVWVSKLMGHKNASRVYGPDLLLAACRCSLEKGWSHFFYGGAPGVADQLATHLVDMYPGLRIAGCYNPPFGQPSPEEDQTEIDRINASKADILWVGLGAPKQEYWMADHLGRIEVPVMVGVGAAFDFLSGSKKQAPSWMRRSGLEWVYRLFSEPRRLWKRYLIYNPLFVWLVFLQFVGVKKFPLEM